MHFIHTGGQLANIMLLWEPSDWIASYYYAIRCTYFEK